MEGCSRCDSGPCSECYAHYGLVNGTCQPCADERCMQCDGNAAVCSECNELSDFRGPPLYTDAATGACKWVRLERASSLLPSRCLRVRPPPARPPCPGFYRAA